MSEDRFDRQRRLAGIGDEGQARIERHPASIPAGAGAAVALAYLERAGVRQARITSALEPDFRHDAAFEFSGPHAVAQGAHAALRELHRALGIGGSS